MVEVYVPASPMGVLSQASGKETQTSAMLSYLARYRLFKALQKYDLLDFGLPAGKENGFSARLGLTRPNIVQFFQRSSPPSNLGHPACNHCRRD
jgi:hypothetical protein